MKVLQPEAALCSTAWRTDGKAAWKKRRGGRKVSRSETLVEIPQNRERERAGVCICRCVFLPVASCLSTCSCQSCLHAPQCVMSHSRCRKPISVLFFLHFECAPNILTSWMFLQKKYHLWFHHLNMVTTLVFSHSGVVDVGQLTRPETQPRVSFDTYPS